MSYQKSTNNLLNNDYHFLFNGRINILNAELFMSALKLFIHDHGAKGDNSLMKTITFAITHFTVAFSVAFLLTGDLVIGSLIAMVEPAINTVAYFFHEKIWARRTQLAQQVDTSPQGHNPCSV